MIPTPWTVDRLPWQSGGTDAHGNTVDSYGFPQPTDVYGWAAPEPDERISERVVIDMRMYGPADIVSASKDRWVLPDGTYEQQGPAQDYSYGPFGFAPGLVINLQRVEG